MMTDNPLADKRPDWEKWPDRWAMCDGGFVYYPGGAKHDNLPELVKLDFMEEKNVAGWREAIRPPVTRPLQDARGISGVKL